MRPAIILAAPPVLLQLALILLTACRPSGDALPLGLTSLSDCDAVAASLVNLEPKGLLRVDTSAGPLWHFAEVELASGQIVRLEFVGERLYGI